MGERTSLIVIPKAGGSSGGVGKTGGRARLFLAAGCAVGELNETRGSSSHGETLSGRGTEDGSSHWTCTRTQSSCQMRGNEKTLI